MRQRVRGRGAESGIELDIVSWAVWTLNEDGQAIRVIAFLDTQEAAARKAAGLPSERCRRRTSRLCGGTL